MSEQAIWAREWYKKNIPKGDNIEPGITSLFELIAPFNRIVVNYDYSGLVYLSGIDNTTGGTIDIYWDEPIRKAKEIPFTSYEELSALDEPNSEGFVVLFPESNERMKIKFPEYVRLHKIVTGLNEQGIWEHLSLGKDIKVLIQNVPDEMFKWVQLIANILQKQYDLIANEARKEYDIAADFVAKTGDFSRKNWAHSIKTNMKYPGIGFKILDGQNKDVEKMIWKLIRPIGGKTFHVDIDK